MKFGAHMSTAGGTWRALQRGSAAGCEVVQVFVKNNMQWFARPPSPDEVARYASELAARRIDCVFGHAGYLINLAGPPSENRRKSIQSLIQEVQYATDFKLPFLVLHPGAHLGAGEQAGLDLAVQGLNEVFAATPHSPVRIALENTAGQGTCLGYSLAHLGVIFDRVKWPERLGVCLDTAHLFAAGYDIRSRKGWNAAIAEISSLVGRRQILGFHLNDSKTSLGSRVDRHEHIGKGKIGLEGFRIVVNDRRFKNHPGCLETPKSEDLHEDIENLAALRGLVVPTSRTPRRSRNAP